MEAATAHGPVRAEADGKGWTVTAEQKAGKLHLTTGSCISLLGVLNEALLVVPNETPRVSPVPCLGTGSRGRQGVIGGVSAVSAASLSALRCVLCDGTCVRASGEGRGGEGSGGEGRGTKPKRSDSQAAKTRV